MGVFWENQFDIEPERKDIYVFESCDGKYIYQLSRSQIKERFKPEEFSLMLEGTHPIWLAYKRG